jgi:DNA-binding PadR family transcriptional regulator
MKTQNPNISNAETALLGLLSEKPMHPYQVEKEVQYRDMRFWTELSMSSIYKTLKKLEQKGLVMKKEETSPENRLRKLYSITAEGESLIRSRIRSLLAEPEHIRWRVDIGSYNCSLLPDVEIREALHEYKLALREKIAGYRKLEGFLQEIGCPLHRKAIAVRPVYLLEAEINWVNSFLQQLGS